MLVLVSSSSRGPGVFTLCELLSEIFSVRKCLEVKGGKRKGKKKGQKLRDLFPMQVLVCCFCFSQGSDYGLCPQVCCSYAWPNGGGQKSKVQSVALHLQL